jgi:CRP/FNR family transcriptional regulator, cyclic AMP receptor protein
MSGENRTPSDRAELEAQVAAHPFFIGMSAHYIRLLSDCAMATRFAKDQVIFRAGETANRFYLIERGKVVLESEPDAGGAPVIIDTISAGDLLGWSWIFPPYIWHFTARAVEPTRSIFFYGTILREYCDKDPALGYELFKRMSEVMMRRLQRARGELLKAMGEIRRKS